MKVKAHVNEHDSFRLYLDLDHFGYYREIPLELYQEYLETEKKFQEVQQKLRDLLKNQPEIDEDEIEKIPLKKGMKVIRIKSEDPIFPVGATAVVKAINEDEKIALLTLDDGSQYTSSIYNISW